MSSPIKGGTMLLSKDDSAQLIGLSTLPENSFKKRFKSLTRNNQASKQSLNEKIPFKVMAHAGKKKVDEFGIKGYHMYKHGLLEKSRQSIIDPGYNKKGQVDPRGFLDGLLKTKMIIPSPSKYDLSRPIMEKGLNPIVVKAKRITEAAQIEIYNKKHKKPGPQDHKVKYTTQEPRVTLGKSDKG